MSQNFQRQKWKIQDEPASEKEIRVLSQGDGAVYQVQDFSPSAFKADSKPSIESGQKSFRLNHLQGQLRAEQEKARHVYAQEIEQTRQAAYEEGMKQGFAQGHQEGLESGHQEGFQKYLIEMRGNIQKIIELTQSYEAVKNEIYTANERVLVHMAYQIAKKIVLKELSVDADYIQRISKDVIDRMNIRDGVRIKVSPKDFFRLETLKKELMDTFASLKNVTVESSDKVKSGCIVETDFNVIDAQIESQLQEVFMAITDKASEKTVPTEGNTTGDVDDSGK